MVLGAGMSVVAFVIERRLLRAIKTGGMKPAPRTAAEEGERLDEGSSPQQGELTAAPQKVDHQADR